MTNRRTDPVHVVIIGGGFAALEAAVALRALAGDRVQLALVSPDTHFRYRPAATLEVFGGATPLTYDLRELLHGLGADYHMSRLVGVAPQVKSLQLESGRRLSYDVLVLAVGALADPGIPGAVTFRDQGDIPRLRNVIEDARYGRISTLAFAIPSCQSWALPAYELALLTAARLRDMRPRIEISLLTPERAPLEVFGGEISRRVAELLAERNVRFVGGVTPRAVSRGTLQLEFDAPVRADAVVAVPALRGHRIPGVPGSWLGFIPTDTVGRVEALPDTFAAGDATTFPIKQGAWPRSRRIGSLRPSPRSWASLYTSSTRLGSSKSSCWGVSGRSSCAPSLTSSASRPVPWW
ncbi:MAG: NAD(P)/FAD-dependent oxidoreductase, partial [Solirubrobacteraceae bacterium]